MSSLLIIAAGGFFNAVRGGQWRAWLKIPDNELPALKDDIINALAFAILTWFLSGDFWLGFSSFFFMWFAAASGWGDYIGALGGWRTNELKENYLIDPIISRLIKKPKLWGAAGLTLRGILWGAIVGIPFLIAGEFAVAGEFLYKGALMAPAYWLAIKWMDTRVGIPDEGWGLGEIFFGMIFWSSLAAVS